MAVAPVYDVQLWCRKCKVWVIRVPYPAGKGMLESAMKDHRSVHTAAKAIKQPPIDEEL